ncbi:hypothetical protein RFI_17503, partial [Reticulomyxa filosa]
PNEVKTFEETAKLQQQLLTITEQLEKTQGKLQLLGQVKASLFQLENDYNLKVGKLQRVEEGILKRLQRTKTLKTRAERVRYAEGSHRFWAFAKLDYTLNITDLNSQYLKNKLQKMFVFFKKKKKITTYTYIYICICICCIWKNKKQRKL